jgi:hypothetical protein
MSEPPIVFQQALAAHRAGRLAEAERDYRATIAAFPAAPAAYANLATLLRGRGRAAEAEAVLRAGLEVSPGEASLVIYLAESRGAAGRWDEAETIVRDALALRPHDPPLVAMLAELRLSAGDYAEGWPLYAAGRLQRARLPPLRFPEWRGGAVGSLLLLPEQGFGDQIMLARYAPLLRARGVAVTIICSPALARLFEPAGAAIIAPTGPIETPPHDAWALVSSLPLHFETRLETIPPPLALRAGPRARGGPRGGLGVMTQGNPAHRNDARRSLPPAAAAELRALPGAVSLHPEDTGARDFQETAELVAGLDLVITVDTAVAHLAASLGKPTWILLPAIATDWRWLRERPDSPWYPSARLFRQRPGEGWGPVIAAVKQALGRA